MLVIHIDVTHTVTHQTTHILPPAGTQNALGESHKKASTQQATRRTGVLARCRRAHGARLGRWRSQKHRQWPSAGVSGGGRDLTPRADDPTSRGTTQPRPNNTTQRKNTFLLRWALSLLARRRCPPHQSTTRVLLTQKRTTRDQNARSAHPPRDEPQVRRRHRPVCWHARLAACCAQRTFRGDTHAATPSPTLRYAAEHTPPPACLSIHSDDRAQVCAR